jgi:hypothetical protein
MLAALPASRGANAEERRLSAKCCLPILMT